MTYYKKLQELGISKNIDNLHVVELPVNTLLYRASADGVENTKNWFGINWFGINLQDVQEYGRIIKTYRVISPIKIILLDSMTNVNTLAQILENVKYNNYQVNSLLKTGWGGTSNGEWNRNTIRMEDYITVAAIGSLIDTNIYDGVGSGESKVGQKHHPEIALFDISKLLVIDKIIRPPTVSDISRIDRDKRKAAIRKRKEARRKATRKEGGERSSANTTKKLNF